MLKERRGDVLRVLIRALTGGFVAFSFGTSGSPARSEDILVEAGLYAEDGVRGSASAGLELTGNLACHTLNRPAMPRWFSCRFDPLIGNHVADNLHGSLSPAHTSL